MNPNVVNKLIQQTEGIAPLTWDECEKHNLKYYQEVFIVPKFSPQTFGEWYALLQKIDSNSFISTFHLKKAIEKWQDKRDTWSFLKSYIDKMAFHERPGKSKLSRFPGGSTILSSTTAFH